MATRQLEHLNAGTAFGKWIREKLKDSSLGLTVLDLDSVLYAFYDYKAKVLFLVEEKAYGDTIHSGQGRTLPVINNALALGCKAMGITYRGLHVIRMERNRPDNSQWTKLDGRSICEADLINTLNGWTYETPY